MKMNSLIFSTMLRYLIPTLWVVALWLLLRGHNNPGGGFIAGLVAASTIILRTLDSGWKSLSPRLRDNLFPLAGVGLGISILSGIFSMVIGNPFMTGRWTTLFGIEMGTPQLFDVGVFVVVFTVVVSCTGLLLEEEDDDIL